MIINTKSHFRFMSSKSGRIYLHTDIRMIICRKSDVDTASDLGSEPPKELRSYIHGPTNPKFSPRCWATWYFPWGCCQSFRPPSPLQVEVWSMNDPSRKINFSFDPLRLTIWTITIFCAGVKKKQSECSYLSFLNFVLKILERWD